MSPEINVKQHRADHHAALNYAKRDAPASSIDTLIIREHRRFQSTHP